MLKLNFTSILFILSIIILNCSLLATILFINSSKINNIKDNEISKVNYKLNNIDEELNHVINNLLTLSESKVLEKYWSSKKEMKDLISSEYLSTITNNQIYDQIRLINTQGMELIRVNFNNGAPVIIKSENLQNKKGRFYFENSISLKKGDVYISPLDLNIEQNQIELPIKPMIRIATPVFNKKNEKQGIVIINYLADHLLSKINTQHDTITKTLLINSMGHFFKGFNTEEEWSFMYPQKKQITFKDYVGDLQDSVLYHENFQFENDSGLFTSKLLIFKNKHFSHQKGKLNNNSKPEHQIKSSDLFWSLIQFIPANYLYDENKNRLLNTIFVLLIINTISVLLFIKMNKIVAQKKIAFTELEKSKNELLQLNENRDRLYSILAHDLKNPFNSMMGFSEVLLRKFDKYDDKKRMELIKIISDGINTTYQLLENLLIWTKSQNKGFATNIKTLNLSNVVSNIIDECNVQSNKKRIKIDCNIDNTTEVYADYHMITTILRNLLSNAIKFSFENSKIIVSATKNESLVIVCIEDFGIGIAKQTKLNLFEKKRTNITSTKGTANESGTGLGLILCKQLIEIQNGEIWLESEAGKGSRFFISIPQKP